MGSRKQDAKQVTEDLIHYGVKGMKWGVRKKRTPQSRVELSTGKAGNVKAKGGENRKPSSEAKKAKVYDQVIKKSGTQALTNKQLREYIERMDLEKRADKSYRESKIGWQFVEAVLRKK